MSKHAVWFTRETSREWREKGYWRDQTVYDVLESHAGVSAQDLALVDIRTGTRLTYGGFKEQVDGVARGFLKLGVKPDDIVVVQLPNWTEFLVAHLALARIGAVTCPVSPVYREHELEHVLSDSQAVAAVIPAHFHGFDYPGMYLSLQGDHPDLQRIVAVGEGISMPVVDFSSLGATSDDVDLPPQPSPDDPFLVMYTSGTEATPKGILHTHNTMLSSARALNERRSQTHEDVVLMCDPVVHMTGLYNAFYVNFIRGGSTVLLERFDAERALDTIEAERVTISVQVTPSLIMMVEAQEKKPRDLSSLRLMPTGAAFVPEAVLEKTVRVFQGASIGTGYGLSEGICQSHNVPGADIDTVVKTQGPPLTCQQIEIRDEQGRALPAGAAGAVYVRGPSLFAGYLNNPEATARVLFDGWLQTGDVGMLDEKGLFTLVGRVKDIIKRGGMNISATEIESLVSEMPEVAECAAVGMPDARLGEKVCVYVVPTAGATVTLERVTQHLQARNVAKYKCPERLEVVEALAKTTNLKVRKVELREDIRRKLAAEEQAQRESQG